MHDTTHSVSKGTKPKKMNAWAKILAALSARSVAILGTIGVGWLLMFLAGMFNPKVDPQVVPVGRSLPADASLVEVRLVRNPRFETAVGTIEPIHQSSVASKLLAKVSEVNVSAGQEVAAGEILVQLNDDDLQSRLKQAEAGRDAARARAQKAAADFNRGKTLIERNAISSSEFESYATAKRTSEAELQRAERAVEEATVFIDYATIRAPYAGIVVDKQVQEGDTVTPGQTLLTLYDPNQMQLVANVRESLAMKLKVGQELQARLDALDHECLATVREVVPEADPTSRSFQVKVAGPCPPGLYSGMFGRLLLPLGEEELLLIPQTAVKRVGQLTLVDVVEGEQLVRRHVQLGRTFGKDIEVLSGLMPGEQVLVNSPNAPSSSRITEAESLSAETGNH